jgi:hypothetical protein
VRVRSALPVPMCIEMIHLRTGYTRIKASEEKLCVHSDGWWCTFGIVEEKSLVGGRTVPWFMVMIHLVVCQPYLCIVVGTP